MRYNDRYAVVFNEHATGYQQAFTTYLYNSPEFVALKEGFRPVYCQLLDHKKRAILISAVFLCKGAAAVSLPEAPFGGIFYHQASIDIIKKFALAIIDHFASKGIAKIVIRNPAGIYNPWKNAIVTNCLINCGFTISHYDINHHIEVDQTAFSEKIHQMEKRKLKGSIQKKLGFQEVATADMATVYNFIRDCRHEKKVNMNITFDQLKRAVDIFPEKYKFFAVENDGSLMAATVAVLAHDNILYNYLPASPVAHNKLSPMVALLGGIYNYCQSNAINILDLGISSINSQPQESLVLFKERVGGKPTLKLTFAFSYL